MSQSKPRIDSLELLKPLLLAYRDINGDTPNWSNDSLSFLGQIYLGDQYNFHRHSKYVLRDRADYELYAPEDTPVDVRGQFNSGYINAHNFWLVREAFRLVTNQYRVPPIANFLRGYHSDTSQKYWYHFPHLSVDTPGNIAFTPGFKYGMADRQVSMKVGRYLAKFYADVLTEEEIRDISNTYKPRDIHWATTGEAIYKMYCNGPHSCMKENEAIQAYGYVYPDGTPEWALAYLKPVKNDMPIDSRALVNMRHKVWFRAYGNEGPILGSILEAAGFAKVQGMYEYDSRLSFIPYDRSEYTNRYARVPYLDGDCQTVHGPLTDDAGKRYWHWGEKNVPGGCESHDACNANGIMCIDGSDSDSDDDGYEYSCDHCGWGSNDDDDFHYSHWHEDRQCDECTDQRRTYAYYSTHDDQTYVDNDEVIKCESNDEFYRSSSTVLDHHCIVCVSNGDYIEEDETITLLNGDRVWENDGNVYIEVGESSEHCQTYYMDADDDFRIDDMYGRVVKTHYGNERVEWKHKIIFEIDGEDPADGADEADGWKTALELARMSRMADIRMLVGSNFDLSDLEEQAAQQPSLLETV